MLLLPVNNFVSVSIENQDKITHIINAQSLQFLAKLKKLVGYCYIDQTAIDNTIFVQNLLLLRSVKKTAFIVTSGPVIPSTQNLFQASFPAEREIYEMFGTIFTGAFDLRKLLCDYSFNGNPLQKKFPLIGRSIVTQHSDILTHAKVILTQNFRSFGTKTPWTV
jgi:NADH:ubiquinone oxidoreductase subunit C